MNKKLIFSVVAVTLIATIGSFAFFYTEKNKLSSVPNLSLHIIDGKKLELSNLKGKPLFVTFWATTCPTCVKEIPHLAKLYNELGSDIFEIVAIAMPYDPPNLVISMSEKKNIPYPVALDIHGEATKAFGNVQVTPKSFLIDSQGNIVESTIGEINIEELRKKVKELQRSTSKVS